MDKTKDTVRKVISLLADEGYSLWYARRILLDAIKEMEQTAIISVQQTEQA